MNILALLTDGFGARGGIARYNRDLMLALSRCESVSEVTILPRFAEAGGSLPPKVRQLAPSAGRAKWSARALALAARQPYDVVLCGHLYAVPLAAALARLRHVPLWVQAHGIDAWQSPGPLHRRGLTAATLVTAVSRYTRARLLAWADVPAHRVRVLPNTVDAAYAPRRPRADLAARYGLAGRRVILTVGRLSSLERYKGHDRIIAALPGVLHRVPDAAYLIVGDGDDRPRLEQLAREAGVADRVAFAGQVPDEELGDHFALASVFAMPSTGEGFGIVYLEAAASGLPVIAGNRDGSVDALAEGRIGRLIDPESQPEIEAALSDALTAARDAADAAEVQRFAFPRFSARVADLVRDLAR